MSELYKQCETITGVSKAVRSQLDKKLSEKRFPLGHLKDCVTCLDDLSGEVVELSEEHFIRPSCILQWDSSISATSSNVIDLTFTAEPSNKFCLKVGCCPKSSEDFYVKMVYSNY